MKRIIKSLAIILVALSLCACSSNNRLANNLESHGDDDYMLKYYTEETIKAGTFNATSGGPIIDFEDFLGHLIDMTWSENSKVYFAYILPDDDVKDDEILVDFYGSKGLSGKGKIYYYYADDGMKTRKIIECPQTNIVLNKEGAYYISSTEVGDAGFTNVELEFGKHYVFSYAPLSFVIDTYYNY